MRAPFRVTPQAAEDLDSIWWFIAAGNRAAADSVEMEIVATCSRLAVHPMAGTKRPDVTPLSVRFGTVSKFPNYVVVYRERSAPIEVGAIPDGKRDLKKALEQRSL